MSNTQPIVYDAESEAYLQRFPELRALITQYGPAGPRLHYENYGKNQGMTWGTQAPAAVAVPAAPPETVSTQPLPASYGTDASSWDAYMQSARQATEGMNQMPFVFSDYGGVPIDDRAALAMFYPQGSAAPALQAAQSNPLLAGIAAAGQANQPQQATANPLLAGINYATMR